MTNLEIHLRIIWVYNSQIYLQENLSTGFEHDWIHSLQVSCISVWLHFWMITFLYDYISVRFHLWLQLIVVTFCMITFSVWLQVMIQHLKTQLCAAQEELEQMSILKIKEASHVTRIEKLQEELREAKKHHSPVSILRNFIWKCSPEFHMHCLFPICKFLYEFLVLKAYNYELECKIYVIVPFPCLFSTNFKIRVTIANCLQDVCVPFEIQ